MLRRMTLEDFELLKPMVESLREESKYFAMYKDFVFTEEFLKVFIDTPNEKIGLIVLDGEEPVGFCTYEVNYGLVARLGYVYLIPEARGKGFMTEITNALEHWAKLVGCKFSFIGVTKEDVDLTKNGYQRCEVVYMKEIN
jgi:RimJ/RimL family protein N-acetyltransferase